MKDSKLKETLKDFENRIKALETLQTNPNGSVECRVSDNTHNIVLDKPAEDNIKVKREEKNK